MVSTQPVSDMAPSRPIPCPYCGSENTRVRNPFGSTVSEMIVKCGACASTFGWMKWDGEEPPVPAMHARPGER